jgi:hypothetical protein
MECGANFSQNLCTTSQDLSQNVENFSSLVQEAGLNKVTAKDVTKLLDSHRQQLSNEDLENWVIIINIKDWTL